MIDKARLVLTIKGEMDEVESTKSIKDYLLGNLDILKHAFVRDQTNFYLLLGTTALTGINYFIWKIKLNDFVSLFYWKLPFSPFRLFLIIGLINLLLTCGTFNQDEEISHLLLGATLFASMLIFTLELFYLINLT